MTMLSVFDEPVMDTNCTRRNSSAVVLAVARAAE